MMRHRLVLIYIYKLFRTKKYRYKELFYQIKFVIE